MTQHCFNTIVFFLMLFVSGHARAQIELFPFEDYQHCTTGFRNNYYPLDTVYQAKFENAHEITYPFQTRWGYQQGLKFWILSDNGKFGCLCSNGEWVLNCLYDTLSFNAHSDQFIAELNGKAGTLKKPFQQVFPFEYDEIYSDQTYIDAESFDYSYHSYDEFYVRKNKLLGVYTFDGNEIVQPQYDSIQAIGWSVRLINPMEKEFYLVTKNGLKGLLAQNGKIIMEPQYQKVQSFYENQKAQNTILFQVTDTLGRFAVLDEYGKQLAPFSEFDYFGAITEWTNQQFGPAGFARQSDHKAKKERMTNLSTGKSSDWYMKTLLVGDWIWAQSKNEWLVLDSAFDTLFRQTDPNDRLFYFDYSAELKAAEFTQDATEPYLPEVTIEQYSSIDYSIPELFVLKHITPQTKQERKNGDETKSQYALLNVSSGKKSLVYDKIIRLGDKGVYYYWCFQLPEDSHSYPVDIYDGTGKLLKSLNVEPKLEELISNPSYQVRRQMKNILYPFFSFQRANGKHVVYGIDGWQPDLPEFDDEVVEIRKWEDSTGYFRFIDSANNFYYADLSGKPLLNGEHFFYGGSGYYSDNQENWVVPMKTNGVYSYINEHLEVLFDSCQEIKGSQYHSIPRLEPTPKTFAIRNGYVYVVLKDSFLLVDAKLFWKPNGMNKIGNDFYVNDEGKMFTEDEVRIYRNSEYKNTGNLLLRVKNNQLTLRKLKDSDDNVGTFLRIIPDVYDYEIGYNALKVITTDKKEGYIDNKTGEWILQPVYEHTRCMGSDDKIICFAQSNQDNHWFVINKEGEPLTKPIFDEPFYFDYSDRDWAYAVSDGKTGLINHQFEWVTEPEYYDREHRYALFLLANDHYAIVDYHTGKSFRASQDSVAIVLEKRFFWFNDSIQILDSYGTELLAPIPASEAKVSKSLRNLLDPTGVYAVPEYADSTYAAYGFIYCPESNHFFTQLSNECILENAKHDLNIFERYDGMYVYNYSMFSNCKREPLFITEHFFSEKVTGGCYDQPELYEGYNQDFSFRNYNIINNQLARVYCVGDLLKHGPEYEDRLNKLLETLIQNNQIFGIACTNMPAAIEELKRNFYIENGDFHFLYYELEHEGPITLAFDEIKDLLREPEAFK